MSGVVFSGTNQGSFISNGGLQIIQLRSDVDWMNVYNYTQMANGTGSGQGVQYYWQRGFATGAAIQYTKTATTLALVGGTITSNGFTLIDNTVNNPGALVALTAIATTGSAGSYVTTVTTASTAGLSVGQIVQLYNVTGASQLNGYQFNIATIPNGTTFTLANCPPLAVAATAGFFAVIPYNPYFYPWTRSITAVAPADANGAYNASGTNAIITLSVTHGYTIGQRIRLSFPTVTSTAFGLSALTDVYVTIINIGQADNNTGGTNTVSVNINLSGGTFAFPINAGPTFTQAQIIPVGQDSGYSLTGATVPVNGVNFLADSEINQGYIGISLGGGANGPAGSNNDVIYWVAGKSFNT